MILTKPTGGRQTAGAAGLAVAMTATVGAALAFQHFGGYMPCELCLKERLPYYIGVPLMIAALASSAVNAPAVLTRGLLSLGFVAMVISLVLAVYHSGVEWHWWAGPSSCTGGSADTGSDASSLLSDLNSIKPPSCDQAAGRFLGLSFAGWNAVSSAVLAAMAAGAAFGRPRR